MRKVMMITLIGGIFPLLIITRSLRINSHPQVCHHSRPIMDVYKNPQTAPVIFVGGHESSGTGLMRVLLDAHPWIRCGAEPMVTLMVLQIKKKIQKGPLKRAISAGIYPHALNNATAAYVLEIIKRMGPPAKLLCHKQPMTFAYLPYLGYLFPRAKFIHMFRDGRAVVSSSISRKLLTKRNPWKHLRAWDEKVTQMFKECQLLGLERCVSVRYEHLVLRPEQQMRSVLDFLGVPWDPVVLRHETVIKNLTNLNPYEPSTRQLVRKIHTDSLAKWAGPHSVLPRKFIQNAHNRSGLLRILGYANLGVPSAYELLPNSTSLIP